MRRHGQLAQPGENRQAFARRQASVRRGLHQALEQQTDTTLEKVLREPTTGRCGVSVLGGTEVAADDLTQRGNGAVALCGVLHTVQRRLVQQG